MSKDNFDQQLRQMFDGFEPDVPLGKFDGVKSELDNLDVQQKLVRQTQVARRLAIGATVVAIGALGWTALRLENQKEETTKIHGMGATEQVVMEESFADAALTGQGGVVGKSDFERQEEVAIARTSTSVHIADASGGDLLPASEPSRVASTATEIAESGAVENAEESLETVASATAPKAVAEERDVLAGLASSVQEACEGTEVSFTLGNGDFDGSVLWNFGDGNFSNDAQPTHVFESPGTYDITISLRSRDNGMIRTKTVENMIVVRPKPDAELNWTAMLNPAGTGLLVKYVDETIGSSSSTWLVDGNGLERGEQQFARSGKHAVHLVASNAYGCQDSQERIVAIGDRHEAKAPGLFSPDGDGRYDDFLPAIVSEVYGDWKLEIMDEAGKVVFETTDASNPWDGGLASGQRAPSGSEYKWILTVNHKHRLPEFYFDTVKIER